jgi:endoglucanase
VLRRYQRKADLFACACLGKGGANVNVRRTPGGMMYHQRWNNIQFVTSASFLLASYSDHLRGAVQCPSGAAARPSELLAFAKSQVDYILGSNPRATSYMVGYGATYPSQAHHRGASIVSVRADPSFVSCHDGYSRWYRRGGGNPNLLDGATVGGPDEYDNFADQRDNWEQTEATTYNNAPLMGVLARLAAGHGGARFSHSLAHHGSNETSLPLFPSLSKDDTEEPF